MHMRAWIISLGFMASLFLSGCVLRTITIDSDPPGALVYLNDEEVGRTPATVPFLWYGDYEVRLSKPGYVTLNTHKVTKTPIYDLPGFDLVTELLPWTTHIKYEWAFKLEQANLLSDPGQEEQLIDHAQQMRTLMNSEMPGTP